jgi:hypothetical protein
MDVKGYWFIVGAVHGQPLTSISIWQDAYTSWLESIDW